MPIAIIIFVGAIIPTAAFIGGGGNWLTAIGMYVLVCGFVLITRGDNLMSKATRYRIFIVCIAFGTACLGVSLLHWPAWALLVAPGLTTTWAMLKPATRRPIPSKRREVFALKSTILKGFNKIRIVKGEMWPMEVRSLVDEHPLGIAAHLLRAIGLSITVGGLFVMTGAIAASVLASVSATAVLTAAGTALAGAMLVHQGTALHSRVVKTKRHDTAAESVR